jgi:hypothetical protein
VRKTVLVCDQCEAEFSDGDVIAKLTISYADAARTTRVAELCTACSDTLPGRMVSRRGRKPKEEAEAAA